MGVEPTRIAPTVLKTVSLTTRTSSFMCLLGRLPHLGIEPKTYTLQRSCSTTELKRRNWLFRALWILRPFGSCDPLDLVTLIHRMGFEPMRLAPDALEASSLTTRTSVWFGKCSSCAGKCNSCAGKCNSCAGKCSSCAVWS